MGYLYENGLQDEDTDRVILEPNFEKAHSYYLKAAEHNFPRALNNLATFYFSNDKFRDEKKCLEFLELASEA
jgi:TPR repeat protein